MQNITEYWPAALFGLFGLAFRWSRMGLPNGGAEPKTAIETIIRLARLWVEATTGSIIFIIAVFIGTELFPAYAGIKFLALAFAALLGAALSDSIGKFIQNPAIVFNWVKDTVLAWFGRSQ